VDGQPDQQADRSPAWLFNARVQRIVGIADLTMAVMMLLASLVLQAAGYPQSGLFGIGPFWVVPAAMICLGVALLRGYGVPRHRR
jgi:hypothetical protein